MLTLPALMPLAYCEARSGDDCAGFEVWVEEVLAVTLAVVLARIPEGVLAVEQPSHHTQGVNVRTVHHLGMSTRGAKTR